MLGPQFEGKDYARNTMKAHELMSIRAANTLGHALSSPEGQEYATLELRPALAQSIKDHGVQDEVVVEHDLGYPVLVEGHHRVIAAHSVDPNMDIPVLHWR